MSATLITHTCVGPVRLSKNKKLRKKAIKQAKTLIDGVIHWSRVDTDIDIDDLGEEVTRLMRKFGPRDFDDWAFLARVDPEKAVEELFELWHGDAPNDVNRRTYMSYSPRIKLRILVAGDMSWGDEPDGDGYRICKQSAFLGLFHLYGIK